MDNFFNLLFDKINDVLYEVLGLLLPYLSLCITLIEPIIYVDTISLDSIFSNNIMGEIKCDRQFWIISFIIAGSYIAGNVIKVISKIYYSFGKAVFDDTIYVVLSNSYSWIISKGKKVIKKVKEYFDGEIQDNKKAKKKISEWPVFVIICVLFGWVKKTFSFSVENYDKKFEPVYIELAMDKLKVLDKEEEKTDKWYLFYKKSTMILEQKNINTLYYKYLSKYNSFRSLECVFLCGIVYNIIWHCIESNINCKIYYVILGINIVCTVSFHEKFKRYWKLCGNEVIFGLDYYYNNEEGHKE